MNSIKNKQTKTIFETSDRPFWNNGVWECGDQRFTDESGDEYELLCDIQLNNITVSPVEFMLLFTSPERIFIKSIRQSDPVVSDFMDIIEHPKLTLVNLSLASTQQAVDYLLSKLVEATVITAEDAPVRRESILSGAFQ
jgi:hypothetical protein